MYFGKTSYQKLFRGIILISYLFFYAAQFNAAYYSQSNFYEYVTRSGQTFQHSAAKQHGRQNLSGYIKEKTGAHALHLSVDKRFEHQTLFCRTDLPYYQRTIRYALVNTIGSWYAEHPVTAPRYDFDFRGPPFA